MLRRLKRRGACHERQFAGSERVELRAVDVRVLHNESDRVVIRGKLVRNNRAVGLEPEVPLERDYHSVVRVRSGGLFGSALKRLEVRSLPRFVGLSGVVNYLLEPRRFFGVAVVLEVRPHAVVVVAPSAGGDARVHHALDSAAGSESGGNVGHADAVPEEEVVAVGVKMGKLRVLFVAIVLVPVG